MSNGIKRNSIIVISIILILDQLSKYFIARKFLVGTGVHVCDYFNLVHVKNPGVTFGMMQSVSHHILICIACLIVIGLCVYFFKHQNEWFASAMIIGGAIGNIIDRVLYGSVVDFLDFHWKSYHWPAFNIADSAVVIGVGILLFLGGKR